MIDQNPNFFFFKKTGPFSTVWDMCNRQVSVYIFMVFWAVKVGEPRS